MSLWLHGPTGIFRSSKSTINVEIVCFIVNEDLEVLKETKYQGLVLSDYVIKFILTWLLWGI